MAMTVDMIALAMASGDEGRPFLHPCQSSSQSADLDHTFPTTLFAHIDPGGDAILHRLHMADNANLPTLRLQGFQRVDGQIQTGCVERAKALVHEQG